MLKRLEIEQLRCFARLDLSFNVPTDVSGGRGWTILVGPNGVGKTTILQSIVLAAIDARAVSALVEAPWEMVRPSGRAHASIRATFGDHETPSERIIRGEHGRYIEASEAPGLAAPLVFAFAARRRIARPGESPPSENHEVERVRGLFDASQPLLRHDPFKPFVSPDDRRELAKVFQDILLFSDTSGDRLFPLVNSFELRGRQGVTRLEQLVAQRRFTLRYGDDFDVKVGLQDLSDGYQSMFALVAEIVTQAALATGRVPNPGTLSAIILVDELEAHLHPTWQRSVVPILRSVFPMCQFIVTTHSPLIVGAAEAGEVHVLEVTTDGDVTQEVLERRMGMAGAEVIYEEVFGVHRSASQDVIEQERRYLRARASGIGYDAEIANLIEGSWRDAEPEPEPEPERR